MIVHNIRKAVVPVNNVAYPRFHEPARSTWDKITYSKWIETVKEKYKIGDYLCLDHAYVYPDGRLPFWYELVGIEEIHFTAEWDYYHREPACLTVRTESGMLLKKAPVAVRHLTEEEIVCVRLQNTKTKTASVG